MYILSNFFAYCFAESLIFAPHAHPIFLSLSKFKHSLTLILSGAALASLSILRFSNLEFRGVTELNLGNRFFVHMSLMTNKFVLRVQNFLLMLVSIPNGFLLFLLVF